MTMLVKVRNLTNSRTRLYSVADGSRIDAGSLVNVEFRRPGCSALGIAVGDSFEADFDQVSAIRSAFGMADDVEFKQVVSVYEEHPLLAADEILIEADDEEDEG